ncbi:hypothetical protein FW755_09375 [Lonepinella koalarum]|uniref:hypothetical protein n=1 Tax=Lonepinella koalarum TaxID=53417 RepID=UPI0011E4096A|nr:hypothetical protein [Lonepinella koalarum]TYG35287.1 hypothetical protein FW755_09375 [Lonepinella koalarum]
MQRSYSTDIRQLNVRLDENIFFYLKETATKNRKSVQEFVKQLILDNFAKQHGIEDATEEEIAIIEESRLYMQSRPHLRQSFSRKELSEMATKVKNGSSLSDLLGYKEND